MGRAQALTRKVLLGWLAAEWFGILVAYLVAYVAFAFLIGVIAVRVFAIDWPIPLLAFTVAGGLYLLFRAFQLPLDLLRQSRASPTRTGPQRRPRSDSQSVPPALHPSGAPTGRSVDRPPWSRSMTPRTGPSAGRCPSRGRSRPNAECRAPFPPRGRSGSLWAARGSGAISWTSLPRDPSNRPGVRRWTDIRARARPTRRSRQAGPYPVRGRAPLRRAPSGKFDMITTEQIWLGKEGEKG